MRSGAAYPWLAALIVLAAFAVIVIFTTPWHPFGDARPEFVPVDPSRDFTAAEQAAAAGYRAAIRLPGYLNLGVGLVAAVVLGLTSLGARLVTVVARPVGSGWLWQVVLGGLVILIVMRLVTLPFAAWSESIRRDYGLSTRDWGGWAGDVVRTFGLQAAGTITALLILVALARVIPRFWWIPAAVGAAALVAALSFVYPLIVEPVFNTFTPMADGDLRDSLIEMAAEDGIGVEEVLVADASRRTTTLNAYVSGYGATHRIVVYDTLLEQAPDAEIRSIVAHELGHTVHHDVRNGTALGALAAAGAVCVLAGLLAWRRLLDRARATGPADSRVIALVLAIVAVLSLAAAPVENLISRRVEARADIYALDLTRDPETFQHMQRTLALAGYSDLEPPTWSFVMFASHPTKPQRMALARTWADLHGEPVPTDLAGVKQ